MTIHLLKLCVGCDTVQELAEWQVERLKELKRARQKPELCHRTLQTPKRRKGDAGRRLALLGDQGLHPRAPARGRASAGLQGRRHRLLRHRARSEARDDTPASAGAPFRAGAISPRTTRRQTYAPFEMKRARCRKRCARPCASFASSTFSLCVALGSAGMLSMSRVAPRWTAASTRAGPLIGPKSGVERFRDRGSPHSPRESLSPRV